jgi:hypothetical protein
MQRFAFALIGFLVFSPLTLAEEPYSLSAGIGLYQDTHLTGMTSAYSAQELRLSLIDLNHYYGIDLLWFRANIQAPLALAGRQGYGATIKAILPLDLSSGTNEAAMLLGIGPGAYYYVNSDINGDTDPFAMVSAKYFRSVSQQTGYFFEIAYTFFPYIYKESALYGRDDSSGLRNRIDVGFGLLFDWTQD